MTISERLKNVIRESELTFYRIGKDTGVSPVMIGRWMSGKRDNIRSDTLDVLADYFDLELQPKKKAAKKRKPKST